MKLITYQNKRLETRIAAVVDSMAVDIVNLGLAEGISLPSTMLDFIDAAPSSKLIVDGLIKKYKAAWPIHVATPISNVKILAPIPRPRKNIFGIGLNYVEHVAESARTLDTSKDLPKQPVVFSKPPTAVIGNGDAIQHNANMTKQLDWEVELAVIIGATCTRVTEEDAMNHVFGYTVINDVSARDCRRAGQWIFSKGQNTFAPMGPYIVTADEVNDPHNLNLWLKKNGEIKQSSNTKHLLFKIPTLIADISSAITLEPGDIIATGTPSGVGAGMDPQEWMWPGDVIELCVEGIGTLINPVVDARKVL
jgi:2-keto-4-pentenoate hydratase/2-oxohepta-3-ene-1,7-dioic acid hydratase in catechol pathway